ncbi:MAG: bifunctional hydroxymethylpyrimidine kinase/phosphomethylpyrimidine kinase [Nitrospirae bacterium]|nr:bifunctional hydroxymethylpyrimidine kinase/phosphomethylpyrimidine kinase [Nitrospirota bacterium]MBI3352968.1 bifunctional hydroxymethylpyrimidine kinase/phosphomethylpyrimidine kinase [Nitrospirota bacterium]
MKTCLSIAGSDPSGGAGIQVDLKTFTRFEVYGMAIPTALTVQNSMGISEVVSIPPDLFEKQVASLFEDISIDAMKTGMLFSNENVERLYQTFLKSKPTHLVIDPIIRSTSGFRLLEEKGVDALKKLLFPFAFLVTPNLKEASSLTNIPVNTVSEMEEAARKIYDLGPKFVLVKGGHLTNEAVDLFYDGDSFQTWKSPKIDKKVHGAGCVLSAAITACLARGHSVDLAIEEAHKFVHRAIEQAMPVGTGALPLNLFH